jgi:hypothetical protein
VPPDDRTRARRLAAADARRALLTDAHAQPRHDLATLAWIPARAGDGPAMLFGLRDLLLHAHELTDLAEPDPLTRAALRRYLTALAAQMVRGCGADHDQWAARLRANDGFSAAQIDALLADQADHLWLYHPVTPFLQDRRLITAMLNPELMPVAELIPHLPGDGEAAWFTKRTDPDAGASLDAGAVARALVTRWFYTLNGNSAEVSTSGGKVSSQAGSPFAEGPGPLTHVFRVSTASLSATLLRNLTSDLVEGPAAADMGLAWHDPDRPTASADPLYRYTLTATSALLGPETDDGHVAAVLRGPAPRPKDEVKKLRDDARATDPHRVLIEGRTAGSTAVLRVSADDHRVQTLNALRRPDWTGNPKRLAHGVVTEARLWLPTSRQARHAETLELLLARKQGAASSPKWSETSTVALPASALDPELAELDGILTVCFAKNTGIQDRLAWAVCHALGRRDRDGKPVPAKRTDGPVRTAITVATRIWLDDAGTVVEQVGAGQTTEAEAAARLWSAARAALRTATIGYAGTVRYAASVIAAERILRRRA